MARARNKADPEQRKRERLDALRQREELRALLNTYGGRAFIWWLLEQCKVYSTSFTGKAASTFFNEGKRKIGLLTLERIFTVDPNAYTLMRNEAEQRFKEIYGQGD